MTVDRAVLLILGMPGSGKTFVGRAISHLLNIPHRSVGDVLRAGRNSGLSPPIDQDPATWFMKQELERLGGDSDRGVILDFSPVTHDGARQLTEMLHDQGFHIHRVVYVRTAPKTAQRRLRSRGWRSGDTTGDIELLFQQRVAQEFRPFTIPMIRDAAKRGQLSTLENSVGEAAFRKRIVSLADEIAHGWPRSMVAIN